MGQLDLTKTKENRLLIWHPCWEGLSGTRKVACSYFLAGRGWNLSAVPTAGKPTPAARRQVDCQTEKRSVQDTDVLGVREFPLGAARTPNL